MKATRAVRAAGVVLAGAAALALPGCGKGTQKPTFIEDTGPARLSEARRLAAEAQREQSAGRLDRAVELYQQALAQTRELGFVQNNLGLLLMQKDNYLDAVTLFQEAADVMPESPKPLYNIGLAYSRRGWDEKAMGFYEKALARQPNDRETLRAAVLSGKRLDLSDDGALARVRRALMVETDPRWKQMQESEQFRIEHALSRAKEASPLAVPPEEGGGAADRATPGPVVTSPPVAAPVVPAARPATPPPPAPAPVDRPPAPVAPSPAPSGAPGPSGPVSPVTPGGAPR